MADTQPLNDATLTELIELLGEETVREVVALFLVSATARAAEAHDAAGREDWRQVAEASHSLRSVSGQLGADAVQALAERAELAVDRDDPTVAREAARALPGAVEQALAALRGRGLLDA